MLIETYKWDIYIKLERIGRMNMNAGISNAHIFELNII